MGSALLRGSNNPHVVVIEPEPVQGLPAGVTQYTNLNDFLNSHPRESGNPSDSSPSLSMDSRFRGNDAKVDLVIFAVKPQVLEAIVPAYARFKPATFLSIAAGKTLATFTKLLGSDAAVVRAMPNTPAAIGQGISVLVASSNVTPQGKQLAETALKGGGAVEWVGDESLMDAVTALSGSGPAYVFLLVEVLAKAGEKMGLAPDLAMKLARQTVVGSGHLLQQSPQPAAELRAAVTSPGGTTAAALEVLGQNQALLELFTKALSAAQLRGQQLAG
jgi:pyrroline-5-carboxylate reductase